MAVQANELRIGNYVYRNDMPDKLWQEIRSISKDRLHPINVIEQDWEKNCFYSSDCRLEDLNPIPLEEEILLRFGFEFTGENYTYPVLAGKATIIIYEGDNDDEYVLYVSKRMFIPLKYVHQLQNLYYALTTQELIITP